MHNKEKCKIIGCGTCDTTASKLLQSFLRKKDMESKELKHKFTAFWMKFQQNGENAFPDYDDTADFWLHEMEKMIETIIDMTECSHERGKLKEYLATNF